VGKFRERSKTHPGAAIYPKKGRKNGETSKGVPIDTILGSGLNNADRPEGPHRFRKGKRQTGETRGRGKVRLVDALKKRRAAA